MVLTKKLKNKKILFVSTRELDYIRNKSSWYWLRKKNDVTIVSPRKKQNIFVTLFRIIYFFIRTDLKEFDVIYYGFVAQLAFIISFFIVKIKRSKNMPIIIVDAFLSMYDTIKTDKYKLNQMGIIGLPFKLVWPLTIKLIKAIDAYSFNKANFLLTDTKANAEFIIKTFKTDPKKIYVFYLAIDDKILRSRKNNRFQKNKRRTVLFFTSFLPIHGVDYVINVAKLLPDVEFIIAGDGPLRSKFKANKLPRNVKMPGWIAKKDIKSLISNADICLGGHFGSIDRAERCISTKTYMYLYFNKPTIISDNKANYEISYILDYFKSIPKLNNLEPIYWENIKIKKDIKIPNLVLINTSEPEHLKNVIKYLL